jgi:hypothetical protein
MSSFIKVSQKVKVTPGVVYFAFFQNAILISEDEKQHLIWAAVSGKSSNWVESIRKLHPGITYEVEGYEYPNRKELDTLVSKIPTFGPRGEFVFITKETMLEYCKVNKLSKPIY